jgi:hypothetical protein
MADALVKLLNRYGYQPVLLPRTGVAPPELYTFAEHRLIRRGPLEKYLAAPLQFTERNGRLGNIEGEVTSGKNLEAAVGFLGNALAALGIASLPKVDLSFAGSKSLAFAFSDVTYRGVDPSDLEDPLQGFKVPPSIPDAYVTDGALHVAFEYAYAKTLVLRRADGQAFAADVSGGVGQWVDLGAQAKVEVRKNSEVAFTSAGDEVAAFAYKAGRLQRAGTRWLFEPEIVMRAVRGPGEAERQRFVPAEHVVLLAEEGADGAPSP